MVQQPLDTRHFFYLFMTDFASLGLLIPHIFMMAVYSAAVSDLTALPVFTPLIRLASSSEIESAVEQFLMAEA